jgi:hypothetical protein
LIELHQAAELLDSSLSVDARSCDVAYLDLMKRGLPLKALERISKIFPGWVRWASPRINCATGSRRRSTGGWSQAPAHGRVGFDALHRIIENEAQKADEGPGSRSNHG